MSYGRWCCIQTGGIFAISGSEHHVSGGGERRFICFPLRLSPLIVLLCYCFFFGFCDSLFCRFPTIAEDVQGYLRCSRNTKSICCCRASRKRPSSAYAAPSASGPTSRSGCCRLSRLRFRSPLGAQAMLPLVLLMQHVTLSLQAMWTEKLSRSIEFQLNQQHGRGETPKYRSGQRSGPPSQFEEHSAPDQCQGSALASHVLEMLQAVRGNDFCAECFAENPTWCSINLGVLICLECSGIHRSLGTHVSKVRSLTLDTKVFTHSLLGMMLSIGNTRANALWMATYSSAASADGPPTKSAPRAQKEVWIRCKYADRAFLPTASEYADGARRRSELTPRCVSAQCGAQQEQSAFFPRRT